MNHYIYTLCSYLNFGYLRTRAQIGATLSKYTIRTIFPEAMEEGYMSRRSCLRWLCAKSNCLDELSTVGFLSSGLVLGRCAAVAIFWFVQMERNRRIFQGAWDEEVVLLCDEVHLGISIFRIQKLYFPISYDYAVVVF